MDKLSINDLASCSETSLPFKNAALSRLLNLRYLRLNYCNKLSQSEFQELLLTLPPSRLVQSTNLLCKINSDPIQEALIQRGRRIYADCNGPRDRDPDVYDRSNLLFQWTNFYSWSKSDPYETVGSPNINPDYMYLILGKNILSMDELKEINNDDVHRLSYKLIEALEKNLLTISEIRKLIDGLQPVSDKVPYQAVMSYTGIKAMHQKFIKVEHLQLINSTEKWRVLRTLCRDDLNGLLALKNGEISVSSIVNGNLSERQVKDLIGGFNTTDSFSL